jgi:hypothetical protein
MRALIPTLAVAALIAVAPAAATTRTSTTTAGAADTRAWCKAVIDTNTKAGTMKNKRFLPVSSVPPSAWKKVVDAAVAGGDRFIALAPNSIRTAVKHEIEWFKRIKANHYSTTTPLGSWTVAEVRQITNFERTKCGITFG